MARGCGWPPKRATCADSIFDRAGHSDSFLATADRDPFIALCVLDSGGLVALTGAGLAWLQDGRDPARLPERFELDGACCTCVSAWDDRRAVIGTDRGDLWIVDPLGDARVELPRRPMPVVAVARLGGFVVTAHPDGALLRSALDESTVLPSLEEPSKLSTGSKVTRGFVA